MSIQLLSNIDFPVGDIVKRELQNADRGNQLFVSTHSPDLLNAIESSEVFWLSKKNGYTTISRAQDNPQVKRYMEDGDKMGYLWKQRFFDGVDPQYSIN